jgi:hypothetical protein
MKRVYHCKQPGCKFSAGNPIGITKHVKSEHASFFDRIATPHTSHINGTTHIVERRPPSMTLEELFKQAEELKSQLDQNSLLIERKLEELHLRRIDPEEISQKLRAAASAVHPDPDKMRFDSDMMR